MAKNVALRRRQELDKLKMKEMLESQKVKRDSSMESPSFNDSKSNSDVDMEMPALTNCVQEEEERTSSHISALALIILNFYNNDPKIAMNSIKKVALELSSLVNQESCTAVDQERRSNLKDNESVKNDLISSSVSEENLSNKKSKLTSSPSSSSTSFPLSSPIYSFNPFTLRAFKPITPHNHEKPRNNMHRCAASFASKKDDKVGVELTSDETTENLKSKTEEVDNINSSPFSIRNLTSNSKAGSISNDCQYEQNYFLTHEKSNEISRAVQRLQHFNMTPQFNNLTGQRIMNPYIFNHAYHNLPAFLPFQHTLHGFQHSFWSKNWNKRDNLNTLGCVQSGSPQSRPSLESNNFLIKFSGT
ncbi:hypothetical protein HELRODRAFT_171685 [Helobdella robusta]|uniref:Uncharacterized protein n=1 Tax=Helobdella robusta TaxID=6412 RepID=T1F4J8_HELRO|nr:hypothetical protein HELRODRAFT_171685 [Helobdella robusta]ESO05317.1 hypothetical protein HELRODRAFT_171685 [Helobdella robusta]